MNRIQIGGYIRITKKEAARRYNAGEVIRLTACKKKHKRSPAAVRGILI